MTVPSKNFTSIADTAIDNNSPIDVTLMTAIRDSLIHLEEWLGMDYTAHQNHNHDGTNSNTVSTPPSGLSPQTAGAYLMSLNAPERTTTSATYVKLKETIIAKSGTYTIKFTLRETAGGAAAYGQIYKNGAAVGTERNVSASTEYSEDIAGFASGDLIQVYGKRGASGECGIKDLKLCGGSPGDFGINETY